MNGNIVKLQYIILMLIFGLVYSTPSMAREVPSKSAVMLEIVDGDTAFIVDGAQAKAWWVVGECRRPIPINEASKQKNNNKSMIYSDIISDNVEIGNRQVTLKQQFRFTLAATPNGHYSVEVFNSLRGGWSPVPVQANANCALDAACLRRMELPEC